jgi:D-alanyl-D-alanine carboxypeptidase
MVASTCAAAGEERERSEAVQQMVAGALAEPVGGVVVLVRFPDGQTVPATHGYADGDRPIDVDDSFRIASITKTYVAALILTLEEDGLLSVDDSVAGHLPDLGVDERITIRQLLTHSSGLDDHWASSQLASENCTPCAFSPEELVALIDVADPAFEPGSHWSYSNTGYVILGMVVEAATGNDLAVELRRRVLEPAGVTDSYLIGLEPTLAEPVTGHWRIEGTTPVEYPWSYDNLMTRADAAGSLVSTAPDIVRFLDALFDGRIVSSDRLAEMLETVPRTPDGGDEPVRFGFGIHHPMDSEWWMHGGGIPGFHSAYLREPTTDATVVVLTNCSGCLDIAGTELDVIDLARRLMDLALADPVGDPG